MRIRASASQIASGLLQRIRAILFNHGEKFIELFFYSSLKWAGKTVLLGNRGTDGARGPSEFSGKIFLKARDRRIKAKYLGRKAVL